MSSDIRTSGNFLDVLAQLQRCLQQKTSGSSRSFGTVAQLVTALCQSLNSSSFEKENSSQQVHFSIGNTWKFNPLGCALAGFLNVMCPDV